ERCGMGAQRIVRYDAFCDQIRVFTRPTRVGIRAPIGIGPSVETSFFYPRDIIRHQCVTQLITLIYGSPQGSRLRFPIHSNGVTQSRSVYALPCAVWIDLKNIGPA